MYRWCKCIVASPSWRKPARGHGGNAWSLIKSHRPRDRGWPCMDDDWGQWVFSVVVKRSNLHQPKGKPYKPTICRCECHSSEWVPAHSSLFNAFQTEPTKTLGWKNNEMFFFSKITMLINTRYLVNHIIWSGASFLLHGWSLLYSYYCKFHFWLPCIHQRVFWMGFWWDGWKIVCGPWSWSPPKYVKIGLNKLFLQLTFFYYYLLLFFFT